MELQTTFYIIGIIFMSLMLLLTIGLAIAVFIIKSKIDAIHRRIDDKLEMVSNIAHVGTDIMNAAKRAVGKR